MGVEIKLPNITGTSPTEQLAQIKSYLYQTVSQLNFALTTIDNNSNTIVKRLSASSVNKDKTPEEVQSNFNEIKSLIIKSAEIVTAYADVIKEKFAGVYVAQSDFADYSRVTSQDIVNTSTRTDQLFSDLQEIKSKVDTINDAVIGVEAHIISGHLYDDENGIPVYGVQIGQKNTVDGVEVFNQFARFAANRLSFFDVNGREVAYISDYKLYITSVEVLGLFKHGGYIIDPSNGLAYKWAGRS